MAKDCVLSRRGNSANPQHYTKFGILQCREEYRQNPPARLDNHQKGNMGCQVLRKGYNIRYIFRQNFI